MPEGSFFLTALLCEIEAGEQVIAPLRTFGTVLVDQVQPVTYNEFIHQWDANAPKGGHYYVTVDQRVSA